MPRSPRLPLQYLTAFRAAAQTQNLRAAAERLSLSHSAVSQQISALELQLGFPVFERSGLGLRLNPAGLALQRGVERAWVDLEQGLQAARAAHGSALQALRITALPSFAQRWLIPRLGRWQALHPEITLELHTSQQLVDLERDGVHVALRQGVGPWEGLVHEPLLHSRCVPVAAPALAQRLIGAPLELLATQSLLGDAAQWTQWFAEAGLSRQIRTMASFNDAGLLLQAAEQGMGAALTRELLAADALLDGRLVRISGQALDGSQAQGYHIVYPPALTDEPAVRALCAWLHAEMKASAQALAGV